MAQIENVLDQLIRLQFPNIKGLVVHSFGRRQSSHISFEDTGDCTKKEVGDFIESFRKEAFSSTAKSH